MFALAPLEDFVSMNLKCDPEEAVRLRAEYDAVIPGYHMSKTHWNTVMLDGTVPEKLLYKWIDDSYDLIVKSLPIKLKEELANL